MSYHSFRYSVLQAHTHSLQVSLFEPLLTVQCYETPHLCGYLHTNNCCGVP